jgi:LmbE family N-acetylglucosaminyl deacetylase
MGDRPCLVLSPHLDDAVLSCCALLSSIGSRTRVIVATVFTAVDGRTWSIPARRFLRTCGTADAHALYADRRVEDVAVVNGLGMDHLHLGYVDALFRRCGGWGPRGRLAVYPTFRFDAQVGRVARADDALAAALDARLAQLVDDVRPGCVVAPLGVGRHVDHLLVRDAARRLASTTGVRVVHYSDFPYAVAHGPDSHYVRRWNLAPQLWTQGRERVAEVIVGYRSQFDGLFPDGVVPLRPEVYWAPHEIPLS